MRIGYLLNNKKECYIIFNNNKPPLKCKLDNNKIHSYNNCYSCGATLIEKYKCAYCGRYI